MEENRDTAKVHYAGAGRQMGIYLGKFMRLFISERQWFTIVLSALIAFLVTKVVGSKLFITMEGTKTGCLAVACVCLWNGMFNSVQVVCRERAMIKREHRSGLSIPAYLGSHMIFQAGICVMQVLILIIMLQIFGVSYPSSGLIFPIFYIDFFITLFLITYASDMMGLVVSCVVHNTTMAMTVMPCILIVQLVFAGIAFELTGTNAKMISNLTITKWGITALCTEANYNSLKTNVLYTQLVNMANQTNFTEEMMDENYEEVGPVLDKFKDYVINSIDPEAFKKMTAQYLKEEKYNYDKKNILKEWGVLLLFCLVFALGGMVSLSFVDHDKR